MPFKYIGTTTVPSTTNIVTFSSIPQTYTDLLLLYSGRQTTNAGNIWAFMKVLLNGTFYSGSGNYGAQLIMFGQSGSPATDNQSNEAQGNLNGNTSTSGYFSSSFLYLPNYRSSNLKSYYINNFDENDPGNAAGPYFSQLAGFTSSTTSAITSLSIQDYSNANTIVAQSVFTLYGIS